MLKYLIIPLNSNAVSFCHYNAEHKKGDFISLDILRAAIKLAMIENLSIQFVYPSVETSTEIEEIVETVDHTKILPADYPIEAALQKAQVIVFESREQISDYDFTEDQAYIIRMTFPELLKAEKEINRILQTASRLNIVISDIDSVPDEAIKAYKPFLHSLVPELVRQYSQGHLVQFNPITDRVMLTEMNNCNAGVESIAISIDGDFFICPGFCDDANNAVGSLTKGMSIRNQQLFELGHAPICRVCDAYHCKRCVWLNRRLTHEVNTPGRVQCILSHIERNTSRIFLEKLHNADADLLSGISIPKIDYHDPFDKNFK